MNRNDSAKPPVDRALEMFVYAPVGLALMAWQALPKAVGQIVSGACSQLGGTEARMRQARAIGEVAFNFGGRLARREVDTRLADVRRRAEAFGVQIPGGAHPNDSAGTATPAPGGASPAAPVSPATPAPPPPARAASPPAPPPAKPTTVKTAAPAKQTARKDAAPAKPTAGKKAAPAKNVAVKKAVPVKKTAVKSAGPAKKTTAKRGSAPKATPASTGSTTPVRAADLPIPSYDGLSASQVVSRLTGLGPADLEAVRRYESSGRGRTTILAAVDRLQA